MSYVATSYARWDAQFGAGRALSDVIVGFNPAYATLVRTYGSELNFLYAFTLRVVAGAVGGIASVFQALAANPATAAAMPHVAAAAADETGAALATLAEAQWADCSALGGASVVDLALPAEVLAAFPNRAVRRGVEAATNGSMVGFAAGEDAARPLVPHRARPRASPRSASSPPTPPTRRRRPAKGSEPRFNLGRRPSRTPLTLAKRSFRRRRAQLR